MKQKVELCSNCISPYRKHPKLILYAVYRRVLGQTGVYYKLNEDAPVMFSDQAILASKGPLFVPSSARLRSVQQGGQGNPLLLSEAALPRMFDRAYMYISLVSQIHEPRGISHRSWDWETVLVMNLDLLFILAWKMLPKTRAASDYHLFIIHRS